MNYHTWDSESLSERVVNGAFAVGRATWETIRFLVRHRRPLAGAIVFLRVVTWMHHPVPSPQEQAAQQHAAERQAQQMQQRLQPLLNGLADRAVRSIPMAPPARGAGHAP